MKHLRFPLFLTLWMTGLGIVPVGLIAPIVKAEPTQLLAQETNPSPVLTNNENLYNQYMQAGYEATNQKDFATAKKQFQKALAERPQDIYAQQALQNIDIYSNRSRNPLASLLNSPLGLILGLIAVLAGMGVAFWLFFRTLSPSRKMNAIAEGGNLDQDKVDRDKVAPDDLDASPPLLANPPIIEAKSPVINNKIKPELPEDSDFPIQTTTRLTSPELLETLVADLRDPNPQIRRKAIWEMAQKADSRAMQPLVDRMVDADSQDRNLILEALSQIGTRTLKPLNQALAISLQDKNPQVRKNAIRDLTRIYDVMSQISQMLWYVLEDSDSDVKATAKWAIDQLNVQMQMPVRFDNHARSPQGTVSVEQSYAESGE